ncbi:hypothetical protein ACHAW5_010600 [Stephanodiscus triporus]|uniref:Guanylate kinase-like domain-containing protein n=1 Tax=Stephanodiscus triporus TaxID=2934178 RepID=A0ABD3NGN1_9STRA
MEDVGDGYYAEYPYRRRPRPALRMLEDVAPLPASFVRTEGAYKVPVDGRGGTGRPVPSHPGYDVVGYDGPAAADAYDDDVLAADGAAYASIKLSLLRYAAISGLGGTVLVDLLRGPDLAAIYAAGAAAGVGYLYLLGIKTDTVGGADAKFGSGVSNVRFLLPVAVLVAVAVVNVAGGDDANPVSSPGTFSVVTPGQFGAAMIGFLTYRAPLFASQLAPVVSESLVDILPGSAAMAVRLASDAKRGGGGADLPPSPTPPRDDDLVTVLLVSGPEGTGKTTLVNRLLEEDDRFVRPILVDRISDGVKFERLESRGEFLEVDAAGRYGLSKEGILEAAKKYATAAGGNGGAEMPAKVVVVDADVTLAKKLVNLSGARLVGVWIGLDDIDKFESLLKAKIASGGIGIPDGETEDAVLRAKVRQVVKDIEFGVVSGVFEFTILNEDIGESVRQLKEAASYCFTT